MWEAALDALWEAACKLSEHSDVIGRYQMWRVPPHEAHRNVSTYKLSVYLFMISRFKLDLSVDKNTWARCCYFILK